MATNSYFSSSYTGTEEQNLHEDLIIESIQIYGIDCKYIPRTLVNYDAFFGEDQSSSFDTVYDLEFYVKSVDGFAGDGNFLSKFGLEIRDEVQLTVAKKRFEQEVTANDSSLPRPREGDIIKLPTTVDKKGRLYEISFVNYEEIYYQLGKLFTYEVTAKVFEFGGESFETGEEGVDDIMRYRVDHEYLLKDGTGEFVAGEIVSTSDSATAKVSSFNTEQNILSLNTIVGEINNGVTITGATSSASWKVVSEIGVDVEDDNIDNTRVNNEGDDIIDFSEKNPFSE